MASGKLFTFIASALALIMCLSACAAQPDIPKDAVSAVETVQQFFDCWNDKDEKGMRRLMYEKMPAGDWQLNLLNSVSLDSCAEREDIDKSDWYEPWYPNPYDFTCVDAEFTIDANDDHVLPSGTHAYGFWLVKESETAGWIIVAYGQG